MIGVIYAKTWKTLTVKMIGYYHDHCRHLYCGETSKLPKNYAQYYNKKSKFVFIYDEDEPLKS